jgi:hypothetical protein
MYRIISMMILALMGTPSLSYALTNLEARPGQWSTMIEIFDNSNNHYLLKTSVNDDPEACMSALQQTASQLKRDNGYVWTNRDKSVINYESKPGAEDKVKVLQLRCVLEPFEAELTKIHQGD